MKKSLRLQILIPFLALIIAASGLITYLGYRFSLDMVVDNSTQHTESEMMTLNSQLDMFLKEHERLLLMTSGFDSTGKWAAFGRNSKEGKAASGLVQETLEKARIADSQILNMFVASGGKEMLVEPAAELPAGFDPTSRDWYAKALSSPDRVVWLEPYIDTATGKMVITAAKAVTYQDQVVGVIGLDIKADTIVSILNVVKIGESGFVIMLNDKGKLLSHPDPAYIGKDVSGDGFYQEIKDKGDFGTVRYTFEGERKIASFYTNATTGWKIAGTAYVQEFEQKARTIIKPLLFVLFLVLLAAGGISWPVTRNIIRPVQLLQAAFKEFQDGKLSARSNVKRRDEIGKLAEGFDEMASQVGALIGQIRQTSEHLSESSQVLLIGAAENTAASSEIATTVQEIATGAGEQASLADRNAEVVQHMADRIEAMERQTEEMEGLSLQMISLSQENVEKLDKLTFQSKKTLKMSGNVTEAILSLDARSEQIGGIVTVIADITSQTNLLALNAAIEAARAGEHGRGFGVVADEVRKLAGHSEEALRQIQEMIKLIRQETKQAAALTEETGRTMKEQDSAVRETMMAFASMGYVVEQNMEGISQVAQAVKEIANGKNVINGNTSELQAICQMTAAGTEEVSASVQEQSASMEQLNHLASQLEQAANTLREEIKRFG